MIQGNLTLPNNFSALFTYFSYMQGTDACIALHAYIYERISISVLEIVSQIVYSLKFTK
jgi:hypothetical protein